MELKKQIGRAALRRFSIAACWVFFTILFVWALAYFLTGDRYPPFMLVNTLALYFFFPLPFAALVAFFYKRRELWIGFVIGVALFLFFWGRLFIPGEGNGADSSSALTFLSYNVLGSNQDVRPAMEILRSTNADIVFLQELNPKLANAIKNDLSEIYPYQVLDPIDGVHGMGTISKLPLRLTEETLPLEWIGAPQILRLEWGDDQVTLVNFHMWPPGLGSLRAIEFNTRAREMQALILSEFAQQKSFLEPVIIAGDANATPQSDTYKRMVSTLEDSWLQGGFGFGHTYPGTNVPGRALPQLFGISVPRWLFRIDYIFHSAQLQTLTARTAPFDQISDHRGVIATLIFNK